MVSEALEFVATPCHGLLLLCQHCRWAWEQLLFMGLGKACVPPALVENQEEASVA